MSLQRGTGGDQPPKQGHPSQSSFDRSCTSSRLRRQRVYHREQVPGVDSCLMQDEPEGRERDAGGFIIGIDDSEATSLEQIRAFLVGSAGCGSPDREEVYVWSIKRASRCC